MRTINHDSNVPAIINSLADVLDSYKSTSTDDMNVLVDQLNRDTKRLTLCIRRGCWDESQGIATRIEHVARKIDQIASNIAQVR